MRKTTLRLIATICLTLFLAFPTLYRANATANQDSGSNEVVDSAAPTGTGIIDIGIGSITINLVDSVTSKKLAGVEFKLSNILSFTGEALTATTDANGSCTFSSLGLGLWYLRETKGLSGYIPYTETITISVGLGNIILNLKNVPYGSIEVEKVDDQNNAVKDAEFSLFSGINTSGSAIFTGLKTDTNGKINLQDITPGNYTLLETAVPEGYHLNPLPHTFEVVAGQKRTVKVVNNTIKRGSIRLYKRDIATNEQLEGAVFGVYSDITYLNKIGQATSVKDAPVSVDNLLPGTYYVKELAVPDGYIADAPPQTVILTEGQTQSVTFLNSRNYPTAGNFAMPLVCGIIGMVFCGLLALYLRKRE